MYLITAEVFANNCQVREPCMVCGEWDRLPELAVAVTVDGKVHGYVCETCAHKPAAEVRGLLAKRAEDAPAIADLCRQMASDPVTWPTFAQPYRQGSPCSQCAHLVACACERPAVCRRDGQPVTFTDNATVVDVASMR